MNVKINDQRIASLLFAVSLGLVSPGQGAKADSVADF